MYTTFKMITKFITPVLVVLLAGRTVSFLVTEMLGGQCVMYGNCGNSPTTWLPVPCVYNGPAKPLTDPADRRILAEMCPDLANETSTCCDSSQLRLMASNLAVPEQILERCPACFHNFKNIYCYLACSPHQSKYLAVTKVFKPKSVDTVQYDLTTTFAYGMFNSCKDVRMPFTGGKAIGVLCGHAPDDCTPKNWLDYMGNIGNGQTPFEVNFHITDKPETLPSGITLYPMNVTSVPCSSPVGNSSACSCQDCGSVPCPTTAPPLLPTYPCTTGSSADSVHQPRYTVPGYQPISLIIQSRGHLPPIKEHYPPPSTRVTVFNGIFNKTVFHKVLDLLITVRDMRFRYHTTNVSLDDVCLHGQSAKHCVIPSMLQYYQNSHQNIDKVAMDSSGFFVSEDYLDHLLVCLRDPEATNETLPLHMSCISDYGGVVKPSDVFCGQDGYNYQNATALVLTFVIKDPRMSQAGAAWTTGLLEFVDRWQVKNKDLLIKTFQPST